MAWSSVRIPDIKREDGGSGKGEEEAGDLKAEA